MSRRVVLVHGYSDVGGSFQSWHDALVERGYDVAQLSTCSYATLTNEVTIKDIAEGFDRALREDADLATGAPFDAIVHSTGMLVLRAWLTRFGKGNRVHRLKHLIGLAPATWGSPLAHKGRSLIGALFKGNKDVTSPDFMEAGNLVLDGLELASRFTWDLAEEDLFGPGTYYDGTPHTPWPFVFCGNQDYGGLRGLLNQDGTDGTVRWAGCALDSRKFSLDLTGAASGAARVSAPLPSRLDSPVIMVDGCDHGSILSRPPAGLVDQVVLALQVDSLGAYQRWQNGARQWSQAARAATHPYQQFIVRLLDERGDPVPDYNVQLLQQNGERVRSFDRMVHRYAADPSLRAFHVDLQEIEPARHQGFRVRLRASSGSHLVGYAGVGTDKLRLTGQSGDEGIWDAQFELPAEHRSTVRLFHPLTTTLIEMRINREPMPLQGPNKVLWFHERRAVKRL